ncbi:MAG TPA: exosortase/archaeosortase family protein [Caldilineaceae bacterium]|nr:exosortase/archaeosortase family protein [Caldilineaceae bacterium]
MNLSTRRAALRDVLVPGLALVVFAVLTWPVWQWLWREWMGNEYYSHGILIPPVSLYLAYQRFRNDPRLLWTPGHGSNLGVGVTAAGVALYLFFLNNRAFYLAAFAMILLLGGMVWTFGGDNVARRLFFPITYLALMAPLPFIDRYTLDLAMFTGVCSSGIARFLGLDVQIVGNAVTLPNADLVIGAQCSGVNSLIALTALLTLVAYLVEGPWWSRVALVVLAAPLALLGNILRVTSLLFVARAWGAQAAFTFYHDYSGIGFFILVLILLLPITRLLRCSRLRPEVI